MASPLLDVLSVRYFGFGPQDPVLGTRVTVGPAGTGLLLRPAGMRGRYLYGALPALAVLVVAGAARLLGRWLLPVVLTGAAAAQLLGTALVLRVYWADSWAAVPGNVLAWSPWPPPLVVPVVLATAAAGGLTLRAACLRG